MLLISNEFASKVFLDWLDFLSVRVVTKSNEAVGTLVNEFAHANGYAPQDCLIAIKKGAKLALDDVQ